MGSVAQGHLLSSVIMQQKPVCGHEPWSFEGVAASALYTIGHKELRRPSEEVAVPLRVLVLASPLAFLSSSLTLSEHFLYARC